jgi:16S rRNA (guanine966-N2)-methyltransferase
MLMRRPPRGYSDSFRIIGGRFRGRRLGFPPLAGLRPTPDRVRQTLFDWLAPVIHGARCLDLFAGSGALGLEASSRGAAEVTFVEREPEALAAIREHLATLGVQAETCLGDALSVLPTIQPKAGGRFDLVFVDPPFDSDLRALALDALVAQDRLAPGGLVYVEGPADAAPPERPGFELHRSKRAGNVGFHLLRRGLG